MAEIQATTINPNYVYVQSTTPSDKTAGKLWVNTSSSPPVLEVSDGTNYNSVSNAGITNLTVNNLLQNLIGTTKLAVANNQPAASYNKTDNMIVDVFGAAAGSAGTIDTGNTNAIWNTSANTYVNSATNQATSGITGGSSTAASGYGAVIYCNNTTNLTGVKSFSTDTALTTMSIYNGTSTARGTLIGTYPFSGNAISCNIPITSGNYYWLEYNGGTTHYNTVTYPINQTDINYYAEANGTGAVTTNIVGIVSISTSLNSGTDKVIQTLPYTLPSTIGTPTNFLVYANNSVTGTGVLSCSVSYDGGTSYTNANLNSITPITSTEGTNLIYKLNLSAGASSGLVVTDAMGIISFTV